MKCGYPVVACIFWCSYGPEDYREIDQLPYDISKVPEHGKGSHLGCKHLRRGCLSHFSIRILKKALEHCLITYTDMNHIDDGGKYSHGQPVDDFVGTRAYYAPHISNKLQQWVEWCLLLGMSIECVHQKHCELVHDRVASFEVEFDRNDFLSRDDIGNIDRRLKHAQYMFEKNDAQSVRIWQAANLDKVFYYSEFDNGIDDESHTPFILGIQQPLQLEWMRKYGHDSILAMDSTFGKNRFKVSLHI